MEGVNHFIVNYPVKVRPERTYGTLTIIEDQHTKKEWKYILNGEVIGTPVNSEIKEGDKVYFDYKVPEGDNVFDGKIKVHTSEVFCYVRDGVIHTFNDYILSEACYPIDSTEVEVDGKKVQVRMKNGLVTEIGIKHDKKLTRVCHVADGHGFSANDVVVMTHFSDQEYEVEGKWYFVIPVSEIVAKVG